VGVLDADITGPSIPKLFGIKDRPEGTSLGLIPPKSLLGISIMSLNLLLPNEDDPVVWRGPLIAGSQAVLDRCGLGDLDYLIVDLPPGTGMRRLLFCNHCP